ncbi:hypothetical protein HMI54_004801, partial [Coelomomyces lativittatus]
RGGPDHQDAQPQGTSHAGQEGSGGGRGSREGEEGVHVLQEAAQDRHFQENGQSQTQRHSPRRPRTQRDRAAVDVDRLRVLFGDHAEGVPLAELVQERRQASRRAQHRPHDRTLQQVFLLTLVVHWGLFGIWISLSAGLWVTTLFYTLYLFYYIDWDDEVRKARLRIQIHTEEEYERHPETVPLLNE